MQLYARENEQILDVSTAIRGKNYFCHECEQTVRLRGGLWRRPHFFHLRSNALCRQHQKGAIHIALQLHLQKQLPDAKLEHSFPTIGRIADVACLESKTIFEIQVSPISPEEAKGRCRDYESIGFRLIWILHEQNFNGRWMRPAESLLRERGAYFSDMSSQGKGMIYDQFEQMKGLKRVWRSGPLQVDVRKIQTPAAQDFRSWDFYCKGDLLDRYLQNQISKEWREAKPKNAHSLYRRFFHLALEKLSE